VRVVVRSPEKATVLAQEGAEVFEGDLDVPASVDKAMQSVSRVVLVTPPVDDVPRILGRPPRSFEQFATDYAATFS
jgi:uncharacterized protein YbjT (DUF2867 family)